MDISHKLVVKDNALIDASFNLSLVEQRIMLMAIVSSREVINLSESTPIEIRVSDYIDQFKASGNNIYKIIKDAAITLKRREFSYLDRYKGLDGYSTVNWVNKATYLPNEGMIVLYFSKEVVELTSMLSEQFTRYYLHQVSKFKSKYSIRLYEILVKWISIGKTPKYETANLRSKLGVDDNEYTTMSNFKKNVLNKALDEINIHSNLTVTCEQYKNGRIVSGFQFFFNVKNSELFHLKPNDDIRELTEKQIILFAKKLAYDQTFASQYAEPGEEYSNLEQRLRKKLCDYTFLQENIDHLQRLGLQNKS